jgi:hypothetical protein
MRVFSPVLFLFLFLQCSGIKNTVSQDEMLHYTGVQVLNALAQRDSAALSKFVNPEMGVWLIYRPGAIDVALHTYAPAPKAGFPWVMGEFNDRAFFGDLRKGYNKYSCDSNAWQNSGFLYSDTTNDNRLNVIQDFRQKWLNEDIPEKDKKLAALALDGDVKFWYVEEKTQRGLVFHLKKHKGKWWLSILNFVDSDCGA